MFYCPVIALYFWTIQCITRSMFSNTSSFNSTSIQGTKAVFESLVCNQGNVYITDFASAFLPQCNAMTCREGHILLGDFDILVQQDVSVSTSQQFTVSSLQLQLLRPMIHCAFLVFVASLRLFSWLVMSYCCQNMYQVVDNQSLAAVTLCGAVELVSADVQRAAPPAQSQPETLFIQSLHSLIEPDLNAV